MARRTLPPLPILTSADGASKPAGSAGSQQRSPAARPPGPPHLTPGEGQAQRAQRPQPNLPGKPLVDAGAAQRPAAGAAMKPAVVSCRWEQAPLLVLRLPLLPLTPLVSQLTGAHAAVAAAIPGPNGMARLVPMPHPRPTTRSLEMQKHHAAPTMPRPPARPPAQPRPPTPPTCGR